MVKNEIYDKISDVTSRLDKTDSSISKLNSSIESLKLQISKNSQIQSKIEVFKESVRKVTDKVEHLSDVFHQKLDHVVNNTRDMSVVHATMTDNVYQVTSTFLWTILENLKLDSFLIYFCCFQMLYVLSGCSCSRLLSVSHASVFQRLQRIFRFSVFVDIAEFV